MRIIDFDVYKNLLKEKSGLVLTPDKSYLLETRLNPVAKKWGYGSLEGLTQALQGVPEKDLINDVVEAMTTNETSFFRDARPFETLKTFVLPYMAENFAAKKTFRLWCAAASSGQEPYSISMMIKEDPKLSGWKPEILGTDISHEILAQAEKGLYSQFEVQRGLPIQLLMNYFTQEGDKWQIKDEIKSMVKYKYFNLLDSMSALGKFDIVFCRNVLIYFDQEAKTQILERIAKQMDPNGFLFLGGAETVVGITDIFKPMPNQRGLYMMSGSIHDAAATNAPSPLANRAHSA